MFFQCYLSINYDTKITIFLHYIKDFEEIEIDKVLTVIKKVGRHTEWQTGGKVKNISSFFL